MKTLNQLLNEENYEPIDMDWLNNEKPVKTKGGSPAIVVDINMEEVPNIIIGKIKFKDDLIDAQWDESGLCIKITDQYGNPKAPHENDNLVKA